jgi:integrase/recombinase XerD
MTQQIIVAAGDMPWYTRSYAAWLDAIGKRSNSDRTYVAYAETFAGFLGWLDRYGLRPDSAPVDVADTAQVWAHAINNRRGQPPSPATVAQRLAIVSSFYRFAIKRGHFAGPNPIERVDRPKVERYKSARALDFATVRRRFAEIDRDTPDGLRDYALLTLAMHTGRRSAELAALNWGDIEAGEWPKVTVHWRRLKGGKSSTDALDPVAARALHTWMAMGHTPTPRALVAPDEPLWLSFARDLGRGERRRLSARSIAYICNKRMGTPRVHDLRHTFAAAMEEAGAKVSEIQAYLGHESIATTGLYLRKIRSTTNPYAGRVSELLGTDS